MVKPVVLRYQLGGSYWPKNIPIYRYPLTAGRYRSRGGTLPTVVEKELCSLSSFSQPGTLLRCLTGWASDVAVACSAVMGTHQNSSLAAAFAAKSNAELSGVVRMEVQDPIFSLFNHFVKNILMYPRARAMHISVFFVLSLRAWSLSQWLQKASQLHWFRLWGKPAFSADSTNI